MLRPIVAGVLGAVLGSGLTIAAQSDADDATRKAITALKSAVVQAYVKKDAEALSRIYGDDYTSTDSSGNVRTKADELRDVRETGGDTLVDGKYDIVTVRRWGDIAVATGKGDLTWRSSAGKMSKSTYYSFNVFENRDGEWKYVAAFLP
jgi:uncharacterized protein (TIGR02246 family)